MTNGLVREARVSPEVLAEVRAGKRRLLVLFNLDGPVSAGEDLVLCATVRNNPEREAVTVSEVHVVSKIFVVLIDDSPLDDAWDLGADELAIIGPNVDTSKSPPFRVSANGVPFWQASLVRRGGEAYRAISNVSARDAVRQLVRTVRQASDG